MDTDEKDIHITSESSIHINTKKAELAPIYDTIIVGTGAAGLFCALHMPPTYKLLLITKDAALNSDSYLAQGGISTLKEPGDYESYFEDTMRAGHYENNKASVEIMINASQQVIKELLDFGVEFDQDENGLLYTREGAHSSYRILHHEDETGREITSKLLERVKEAKNNEIMEYSQMVDIIVENAVCIGIVLRCADGTLEAVYAKTVILATGGLGGLFENSTNFRHITADGLAIALKHGVEVQDIDYIQIHPTALYSKKEGRRFLISESVRGEGAVLLNEAGERFVDELLPRDLVSIAIQEQMEKYHTDHVYLSVTHLSGEKVAKRFPNIYKKCLEEGFDMTKEAIPVTPAQHYFMGGIKVDSNCKTSMRGLYAVGEASCNGVHGANRLASNSLLESLVFAERAAMTIAAETVDFPSMKKALDFTPYTDKEKLAKEYSELVLNEIKRRDETFYDKWCRPNN